MDIEKYELAKLLYESARLGAAHYVKKEQPSDDRISERKVFKEYGKSRIDRWIRSGVINPPIRMGSTIRSKKLYSRTELMAAEAAEKIID